MDPLPLPEQVHLLQLAKLKLYQTVQDHLPLPKQDQDENPQPVLDFPLYLSKTEQDPM